MTVLVLPLSYLLVAICLLFWVSACGVVVSVSNRAWWFASAWAIPAAINAYGAYTILTAMDLI